jgi:hypothetical protein
MPQFRQQPGRYRPWDDLQVAQRQVANSRCVLINNQGMVSFPTDFCPSEPHFAISPEIVPCNLLVIKIGYAGWF